MPCPGTHPRPTAGPLLLIALCLLALLAPMSASAAERVGRVLIASGAVTAERDGVPARSLNRKDPIYARDTIETGADGRIQIQFSDGGMVDLQPDTRFRIAEYELDDDGGGSAVMEFLRGALRTVTGSIGDDEDDEYRMDTPVATIGIRGTAYALHYCNAACAGAGGQLGLYGRVDNGEISVGSVSDAITVGSGQFFFVPEGGAPRQIVAPPDGILDGNGDNGDGDEGTDPAPGTTQPPDDAPNLGLKDDATNPLDPTFEASETVELRPGVTGNLVFGGAFVANGTGGTALLRSPDDADVRLKDSVVIGTEFPIGFVDASGATLTGPNSLTVTDSMGNDDFTVVWGRWQGPIQVDGRNGTSQDGLAFVYTDPANLTDSATLSARSNSSAIFGGANSNYFSGPKGLGEDGGLWDLDSINLGIDFNNDVAQVIEFELSSSSNSLASTSIGNGILDAAENSLTIDNIGFNNGSWEGIIDGRFVGSDGQALIIKYDINRTDNSNSVKGVAIVEEAPS